MGLLTQKLQDLAIAMKWKLIRPRLNAKQALDIVVVSPGGVGTTFLMEHLAKYKRLNGTYGGDWLKHMPRPPRLDREADNVKFIFVYGDPDDIEASLRNRGWLNRQGAKLGSVSAVLLTGAAKSDAFKRAVRKQIRNWTKPLSAPVLQIQYAEIWSRLDEIAEFVGVADTDFIDTFPERKPRTSTQKAGANADRLSVSGTAA